jgi:hypothetical protein
MESKVKTIDLKTSVSPIQDLTYTEKFNEIHITNVESVISADHLNKLAEALNDNAKLSIVFSNLSEDAKKEISTNLTLSGYIISEANSDSISATKKQWVKNKKQKKTNPWKDLKMDAKVDLVLENELIDPFDNYQKFSKVEDCITKPKPCKNCNCGRANENKEKSAEEVKNFKPECGKCYLGDAFRCAGCPYRGMPAFEPGDKVKFNATDDLSLESEVASVSLKDKKVKIDI